MVKIHVSSGSASMDKHHAPTDPHLTILGFGLRGPPFEDLKETNPSVLSFRSKHSIKFPPELNCYFLLWVGNPMPIP